MALLLIGAVGCGSSHHHKGDGGDDDDGGSEIEPSHDASTDSRTTVNRTDGGRDGGGGTDLDGGDGGGSLTLPDGALPDSGTGSDGGGGGGDGGGGDAGDAGGGGTAVVSTTAVSFGLSPCGGTAPDAQTITLKNPTASALTYTATLSATSAFALTGATNSVLTGSVAAGATGTLTLTATGVAATAVAGQTITATLDLVTNAAAPNDHLSIPVTIVPQGATLIVVPSTTPNASFGVVPFNGTPSTLPITIQNVGNVAATVTVTQPTVTQFTLLSGTSAASTVTVPAATGESPGSVALTASFAPTYVGPLASSASLTVAGAAVCGASSAAQVSFDGTGSGAGFVASTTTPLAAFVDCGATGTALPAATIAVGNFTPNALTYTASMLSGASSPFTLSATSATVNSQATSNLTVSVLASAAPQTATPGAVITDSVVLTPPAGLGLSPIQLPVSTTVRGAVLSFGSATPFNSATNASPQPQLITVNNVGNAPVSPTISTTGGDATLFTITGALTPAAVPGGSSASPGASTLTVSFTPPVGDAAPKTTQLVITPSATDVLCSATAPTPLTLTGTAATPGFHLDTPTDGTLAFGNAGFVDCPAGNLGVTPVALAAAGVHHVRFTNTGSTTLAWQGALGQGTNLFTADTLGGSLAAGQQAIITLTPQPIPYPASTATDAYSDVLTITTDIINDTPHPVNLKQTAQGAVVTASASATDFGLVHSGLTSALNPAYTFQNSGNGGTNLTVTPTLTANAPTGFVRTAGYPQYTFNGVTNSTAVLALPANSTTPINGLFAPGPANGDAFASSVLEAFTADNSPLCAPLPTNPSFAGTGTAAVVSYSSTNILFPQGASATACGSTATPITVVVSNTGNQDFTITGLVLSGTNGDAFNAYIGAFNVVTASVPAASNGTPGTAAITIAPKQVPASNGGAVTYSATLTVPYSIAGEPQPGSQAISITEESHCP